jgi:CRISPR-associated protein Cas1
MQSLYVSQQGCQLKLRQHTLLVEQKQTVLNRVQLPLVEQVLVFGRCQVTTSVLQACLQRDIPLAYLSQMGRCYGRLMPTEAVKPQVLTAQLGLSEEQRLGVAQGLVAAKLHNSRVILQRQGRRRMVPALADAIAALADLMSGVMTATSIPQLLGLEGAGAATYFGVFGACIDHEGFTFTGRSRRPPLDPVNALLSFGYQVLWNHLLLAIEMQRLSPYWACLHQGSDRHPALASDLLEPFRAPLIDSVVLYLINRAMVDPKADFEWNGTACYLNHSGRRQFLQAFVQRMHEEITVGEVMQPRWALLSQQVKAFKHYCQAPELPYVAYRIR